MGEGKIWPLIELDEGEGGAGHILIRPGQGPDQAPRQGRFSRAERSPQADRLAAQDPSSHGRAQGCRGLFVGQMVPRGGGVQTQGSKL